MPDISQELRRYYYEPDRAVSVGRAAATFGADPDRTYVVWGSVGPIIVTETLDLRTADVGFVTVTHS